MKKEEIKLTKEEKRMLSNAFVNTEKIGKYQEKLQELLKKLAV